VSKNYISHYTVPLQEAVLLSRKVLPGPPVFETLILLSPVLLDPVAGPVLLLFLLLLGKHVRCDMQDHEGKCCRCPSLNCTHRRSQKVGGAAAQDGMQ
jgi:hypothetical protein